MSIIAVRKYPTKIVLSADTQTSWGQQKLVDSKTDLYIDSSKIWQHNDLAVGSAGAVFESNLFKMFTKTHQPVDSTVESILDFLIEFGSWAENKRPDFELENHLIIIFGGKVFQALDYDVREVSDYNAVGSGMFLAIGAMYMDATPEQAVDVAKQFDLFCSGNTETIEIAI